MHGQCETKPLSSLGNGDLHWSPKCVSKLKFHFLVSKKVVSKQEWGKMRHSSQLLIIKLSVDQESCLSQWMQLINGWNGKHRNIEEKTALMWNCVSWQMWVGEHGQKQNNTQVTKCEQAMMKKSCQGSSSSKWQITPIPSTPWKHWWVPAVSLFQTDALWQGLTGIGS